MAGSKRRTTPVVVRPPRTAPLSLEDHQQAVTALASMRHRWPRHANTAEHQCQPLPVADSSTDPSPDGPERSQRAPELLEIITAVDGDPLVQRRRGGGYGLADEVIGGPAGTPESGTPG